VMDRRFRRYQQGREGVSKVEDPNRTQPIPTARFYSPLQAGRAGCPALPSTYMRWYYFLIRFLP